MLLFIFATEALFLTLYIRLVSLMCLSEVLYWMDLKKYGGKEELIKYW